MCMEKCEESQKTLWEEQEEGRMEMKMWGTGVTHNWADGEEPFTIGEVDIGPKGIFFTSLCCAL